MNHEESAAQQSDSCVYAPSIPTFRYSLRHCRCSNPKEKPAANVTAEFGLVPYRWQIHHLMVFRHKKNIQGAWGQLLPNDKDLQGHVSVV